MTGISGITAPSPSENSTVGRYTIGPNRRRTVDALLTVRGYSRGDDRIGSVIMLELDLSADIQALRHTFGDISEVVDVARLRDEIARLSEEAGAPDLWDDTENAQKVTSALSHRQSELARVTGIAQRLDDLEVLVDLANVMGDEDSAQEARTEL